MVGLVLVSHSRAVADGTAILAREMAGPEVTIEVAGGLDGDAVGTDATRVLTALEAAWSDDGVLVLMDLGSAVLSTELALDFLDPDRRASVLLSDAPFVEGAVAAAVAAKLGRTLEAVAEEARGGLLGKAAHLRVETPVSAEGSRLLEPVGPEVRVTLDVDLPHGLHARPAARLVRTASGFDADVSVTNVSTGRGPVSALSLNAVATLGVTEGQRIDVVARGPEARLAADALSALAARRFDEELEDPMPSASMGPGLVVPGEALIGVPASPGVAVGPARRLVVPDLPVPEEAGGGIDHERARLDAAIAAARGEISRQRDDAVARFGAGRAAIFDVHLLFLEDEALRAPAHEGIATGRNAAAAWASAVDELSAHWLSLEDPYLRARAADLRAVGRRVGARIIGIDLPHPRLDVAGILVAGDLEPADTIDLDPERCRGIATAHGAATSHAAILARSLGIPAVVGLGDAILSVADGTSIGLDGSSGVVDVAPNAERVRFLETAGDTFRARERAARERAAAPASTRDGERIDVLANIGGRSDVPAAIASGCDGVGLFRTEFLFLDSDPAPDEEEQEAVYREAAEALAGRPLTIRTLDAGADKPVSGITRGGEANPALGLRGIRLTLTRPDVFGAQLRAIARVAVDHDVRVLFPMIATIDELRAGLATLDDACRAVGARVPPVGVMIEVPSAALLASRLVGEVSFFSIGTNDLTQYVMAADRGNDAVASLVDALHPAVLRLVGIVTEAAAARTLPVAVCGEIAGDPIASSLLLGLGVRELSMSAPAIPAVKDAVRRTTLPDAAALANDALSRSTAAEVRALLAT